MPDHLNCSANQFHQNVLTVILLYHTGTDEYYSQGHAIKTQLCAPVGGYNPVQDTAAIMC